MLSTNWPIPRAGLDSAGLIIDSTLSLPQFDGNINKQSRKARSIALLRKYVHRYSKERQGYLDDAFLTRGSYYMGPKFVS